MFERVISNGARLTSRKRSFFKAALIVVILFSLISNPPQFTQGAASNLNDLLAQKQQTLKELNEKIKRDQAELNKLVTQKNTLQNQIAIYTTQINQTTTQIVATQTNIEVANDEIGELNISIGQKDQQININRDRLEEIIRTMYELDNSSSTLIALMNNDNLSDFLDAVMQLENLQGESYELLQTIKEAKLKLEEEKAIVEDKKAELEELRTRLQEQKKVLDHQVVAKNDLLKATRGKEETYRQLLAKSQEQEDKVEQEIQDLENEIRKSLGQRTSPGKKGLFTCWPMNGYMTQKYGKTGFTALGYNFHNGIDLAAAAGTPIYSAYAGTIVGTGSSNYAYGNWVAIEHELPNGRAVVTLYSHMLRVSVKKGQEVKACQAIGTEGNSGNTTRLLYGPHRGFHLHFTVFDKEGFTIVPGKWGTYSVPVGYTYDPQDFL